MVENTSSISNAKSYREMGEFWDSHDLGEVWDETEEITFKVNLPVAESDKDNSLGCSEVLRAKPEVRTVTSFRP